MGRVGDGRAPDETVTIDEHRSELGGRYLLVIENGSSSRVELPPTGVKIIGRVPEADLRLDHSSVSRRHAQLILDRGEMRISDLDSRNGTRVNGETLICARALATGDVVAIGEVLLVVHAPPRRSPPRELQDEHAWRRRLAEEVERAVTYARPLAVLAIAGLAAASRVPAASALARALRAIDIAGVADDGHLLVLLPEADRAAARRTAETVARALEEVAPDARTGVAACPWDAADADSLVLAARAGARVAAAGGVAPAGAAAVRLRLGEREVLLADPAMVRVFELLERLAAADLPVLLIGETGSGKENAAYAVHQRSARRDRPFVPCNCSTLTDTIADSELFGHDRGAFTGATGPRAGLFESVAGGTLFLDEVGELSPSVQAKLLRAIETQRITRVGEHHERTIDMRVVAATNRVLEDEVAAGRFREDLYYRLGGARVVLPPIRDRRCEIPILFAEFLARAALEAGRDAPEPTPATMATLLCHEWPGNARELRNLARFVIATVAGDTIEPHDVQGQLDRGPRTRAVTAEVRVPVPSSAPISLPVSGGVPAATPAPAPAIAAPALGSATYRLDDEVDVLQRQRILEALAAAGGVKTRAAQMLGMPIRTFTNKLKLYGIK